MLLTYRGWASLERNLEKLKGRGIGPRVIVLAGKHEPLEPTDRIVRKEIAVRGVRKAVHEYFRPEQALFLAAGREYTAAGHLEAIYHYAKNISQKLGSGLFVGRRGLTRDRRKSVYDARLLQRYAKRLNDFIEMCERSWRPPDTLFWWYLEEKETNPLARRKMKRIHERVFREKWGPEDEITLIERIEKIFPQAVYVSLHCNTWDQLDEILFHPKLERFGEGLEQKFGKKFRVRESEEWTKHEKNILVEIAHGQNLQDTDLTRRHRQSKGFIGNMIVTDTPPQIGTEWLGTSDQKSIPDHARFVHKLVSHLVHSTK